MVRRSSLEKKEDPGDTKPRGLTNTNTISNAGDTSQMITNVSTAETTADSPLAKLQPRPAARADARALILSMATGAAALSVDEPDAIDQCARIVGVCLWRNVDEVLFGILVDDLTQAANIRSGGSLSHLGDVEDTAKSRGTWIAYYEQWAEAHLNELLYELGYGL